MRWTSLVVPAVLALALGCEDDDGIVDVQEQQVVAELKVTPATASIFVGAELQLNAEPLDSSGRRVRGAVVYWTTYDQAVVNVSRTGHVYALAEGTARLRAGCHGIVAEVLLTVELDPARPVATVRVVPDSLTVLVGGTGQLSANPLDSAGQPVPGAAVSWSSSDPRIVRVDGSGRVTGMGEGFASITASSHAGHGVARVRVEPVVPQPNPGSDAPFDAFGLHWAIDPDVRWILLYSVWGSSPSDVFAVGTIWGWGGDEVILHYDGTSWLAMSNSDPGVTTELTGVWGSSGSNVFAVGGPFIVHYDGTTWAQTQEFSGYALAAVWGSSGTDVFAVGNSLAVLHYDGTAWSAMETPGGLEWLVDVWGSSGNDVFAVGGTTVLHYDGTQWRRMNVPATQPLGAVWGSSASDVFAAGVGGAILHYDGSTWTPMQSPTTQEILALWGNGPDDVYAAGSKDWYPTCCAELLHYDGSSWSVVATTTGHALFGMWGTPDTIFMVGSMGVMQGRR